MIALHEKLLKICPVIKEVMAENTDDDQKNAKRSSLPRLQGFGPSGGAGLGSGMA